jgi:hypothetical protein
VSRRERPALYAWIEQDLTATAYGDARIRMVFATSEDRWTLERWSTEATRSRADVPPTWLAGTSEIERAQWTVGACDAVARARAVDVRLDVGRGAVWSPGYLGPVEVEPSALRSPVFRAWCDCMASALHPHDLLAALRACKLVRLHERWTFRGNDGADPVGYDGLADEDRRPSVAWSYGPDVLRARAVLAEHEAERLRGRAAEIEAAAP